MLTLTRPGASILGAGPGSARRSRDVLASRLSPGAARRAPVLLPQVDFPKQRSVAGNRTPVARDLAVRRGAMLLILSRRHGVQVVRLGAEGHAPGPAPHVPAGRVRGARRGIPWADA